MTHEPSVGFAADGYARVHGLGLACVTYCVGGLNMVNAIACAYAEKSPVIVVSGAPSPGDRKHDPLLHHKVRTFDTQKRIYDEVTCASAVLVDPQAAVAEAAERISQATQPVIIADIELHRHGLTDLVQEIAKAFNIPIAATLLSKSIINETNPL